MKRIILILLILWSCLTTFSATKTATATGNWSVSGNWSPSGEPTSADSVIIPAGISITSNQNNQSCYALVVYGTFIANKNNLNVTNVYNYGAITSNGNNFQSAGTIINTGTFDSNGNGFTANIITNSGTFTLDGTGINITTLNNTGTVIENGINLPIELISFNAFCINNKINFYWSTASETNNDYFTIEKSFNTINFEEIKKIKGAGNSQKILNYTADIYRMEGINYFRLKQTDYDGKFTFSDIVVVECLNKMNLSIVYQDDFIILNADYPITINIISLTGSILKTLKTKNAQLELKGAYILQIITKDEIRYEKIIR